MRADNSIVSSPWAVVHLLHSHADDCIKLSETCVKPRTKLLFQKLALDLLYEAKARFLVLRNGNISVA
jgi:hypothetical protein